MQNLTAVVLAVIMNLFSGFVGRKSAASARCNPRFVVH